MALLKEQTNNSGVVTHYHRVDRATLQNGSLSCTLQSYVSKEYREQDKAADSYFFNFYITLEEEESMGIRQLCYTKIKEMPEWADAQDC